ncbi:MAG: L-threonylcarbamoyladenylate synthase [Nitrosomonas sp.]|nr:L-threonylcarbamoyladenylate synthase [Nitrosomonas sp.]MDP1950079.1 L-threonylcarbamoyladenylate synthase [Nitrosomonas sp.]
MIQHVQTNTVISPEMYNKIATAAELLRAGAIVAFPTETVYGLGADISTSSAVSQLFEIKGRPTNHPLIVHFADASQLQHWAQEIPDSAWKLAEYFWPGPLTLILQRSHHVPVTVTGGQNSVGLRVPDHPIALALLETLGADKALAAPSANRFGRISPTTASHVRDEFGQAVDMILDGGACKVGLESTIVSFSSQTATVLRPGGIPLAALAKVLKGQITLVDKNKLTERAPGMLAAHYAPATPLEICASEYIWQHAIKLEAQGLRTIVIVRADSTADPLMNKNIVSYSMPQEPMAYGNQLYAILRQFDRQEFDRLLIEMPPDTPAWLAITDRLLRAGVVITLNNRTTYPK